MCVCGGGRFRVRGCLGGERCGWWRPEQRCGLSSIDPHVRSALSSLPARPPAYLPARPSPPPPPIPRRVLAAALPVPGHPLLLLHAAAGAGAGAREATVHAAGQHLCHGGLLLLLARALGGAAAAAATRDRPRTAAAARAPCRPALAPFPHSPLMLSGPLSPAPPARHPPPAAAPPQMFGHVDMTPTDIIFSFTLAMMLQRMQVG